MRRREEEESDRSSEDVSPRHLRVEERHEGLSVQLDQVAQRVHLRRGSGAGEATESSPGASLLPACPAAPPPPPRPAWPRPSVAEAW